MGGKKQSSQQSPAPEVFISLFLKGEAIIRCDEAYCTCGLLFDKYRSVDFVWQGLERLVSSSSWKVTQESNPPVR